MKVYEMKDELEKVAKAVPELRPKLDDAYTSEAGKKSKIKLLWNEYAQKHKELKSSRDFKHLNLH